MQGITIVIIIILAPITFQVFMLAINQSKRHKEMFEILKRIEESMAGKGELLRAD